MIAVKLLDDVVSHLYNDLAAYGDEDSHVFEQLLSAFFEFRLRNDNF